MTEEQRLTDLHPLVQYADHLLHAAWTSAVGTPGYDKQAWLAKERELWACTTKAEVLDFLRRFKIPHAE